MGRIRRVVLMTFAFLITILGLGRAIVGHRRAQSAKPTVTTNPERVVDRPTEPRGQRADASSVRNLPSRMLSHPLVLLVVGAVLSSLLIPSLTRQWQDNQKALEVKTAIVSDINEASTLALESAFTFVSGRYTAANPEVDPRYDYNKGYEEWAVQSAEIEGRLRTYLGDYSRPFGGPLFIRWGWLQAIITDYYALIYEHNPVERLRIFESMDYGLETIGFILGLDNPNLNRSVLTTGDSSDPNFLPAMESLKNWIEIRRGVFLEDLLQAEFVGFETQSPFDKIVDLGEKLAEL